MLDSDCGLQGAGFEVRAKEHSAPRDTKRLRTFHQSKFQNRFTGSQNRFGLRNPGIAM